VAIADIEETDGLAECVGICVLVSYMTVACGLCAFFLFPRISANTVTLHFAKKDVDSLISLSE
jgi:hypothetical protein